MNSTKMFRVLLLLIPCCFFSCATLVNGPVTTVTVRTMEPTKIVFELDTLKTVENAVYLAVPRSSKPIFITAITDSVTKPNIAINPKLSSAFYGNFLGTGLIGFAVDWTNDKRFTYPKEVFLYSNDTISQYFDHPLKKKGQWNVNVGVPYVNSFLLKPTGEPRKNNTGFWGISVGADYYYKDDRFVNVTFGAATDFFLPVIGPVTIDGEHESLTSVYVTASNNQEYGRFSFGYGVVFARNGWNYSPDYSLPYIGRRRAVSKYNNAGGLLASVSYRLGKKFHLGLNYKPYFIRFNRDEILSYQHTISFELIWKLRM